MKIAYLIMAHDNPAHLQRLIKSLSSDSSRCFVHIDKKTNLHKFSEINHDNVCLSKKRIAVFWGDFSEVRATLLLMHQALESPQRFSRFVLLSGADYPMRSEKYIEDFFKRNLTSEFIDSHPLPFDDWAGGGLFRLTQYKFLPTESTFVKFVWRGFRKLGFKPRERDYKKYLRDLIPYGGEAWWALTREACQYIMKSVNEERKIINFFKHTYNPLELLFQTILSNSPFKLNIRSCLTYTDWSKSGNPHPAIIDEKHLVLFSSQSFKAQNSHEFLFARKFTDDSSSVVDALDRFRTSSIK